MHSIVLTDKKTDDGLLNTLIAKLARQGRIFEGYDLTIYRLAYEVWDMQPQGLLQIERTEDGNNPIVDALIRPALRFPYEQTFAAMGQAKLLYSTTPLQRADTAAKQLVVSATTKLVKTGQLVTGPAHCPLIVAHERTLVLQGSMLLARAIHARQHALSIKPCVPEVWKHTGRRHTQRLVQL